MGVLFGVILSINFGFPFSGTPCMFFRLFFTMFKKINSFILISDATVNITLSNTTMADNALVHCYHFLCAAHAHYSSTFGEGGIVPPPNGINCISY